MITPAISLALSLNLLYQLDDLLLDRLARPRRPRRLRWADLHSPRRLALLIPFWKAGDSLRGLERQHHHIFLGVHQGDLASWRQALPLTSDQVTLLPHPENASRAEAIRHLCQVVLGAEGTGLEFDGFVLLEGSDRLHPQALPFLARELGEADLVQLPLLFTHRRWNEIAAGAYADEQADQLAELLARSAAGLPTPTRGTGLALSREALRALVEANTDLSSGYELGLAAGHLGFRSALAYASVSGAHGPELLCVERQSPTTLRWALRRRVGWAGENAQGLRLGWPGDWREKYFLWRDRRGFVFFLTGFASSLLVLAASFGAAEPTLPLWVGYLALANVGLLLGRAWIRTKRVAALGGWRQGLASSLRWPLANFLGSIAHGSALAEAWRKHARAQRAPAGASAAASPRRRYSSSFKRTRTRSPAGRG